jgi:hypothetical protein
MVSCKAHGRSESLNSSGWYSSAALVTGLLSKGQVEIWHAKSPQFSDPLVQNSRYKDGTTKSCSIVFSVVPYKALQSDRCLVITT